MEKPSKTRLERFFELTSGAWKERDEDVYGRKIGLEQANLRYRAVCNEAIAQINLEFEGVLLTK